MEKFDPISFTVLTERDYQFAKRHKQPFNTIYKTMLISFAVATPYLTLCPVAGENPFNPNFLQEKPIKARAGLAELVEQAPVKAKASSLGCEDKFYFVTSGSNDSWQVLSR